MPLMHRPASHFPAARAASTARVQRPVRRNAPRQRGGFTLIELLTVIAIIVLLIGIVTPALSRARQSALKVATKAILNSITAGCELFRNDENEYPKSNVAWYSTTAAEQTTNWEVATGTTALSGANLIVDAMTGRDLGGYDSKKGTALGNSVNSRWYNGANNTRSRKGPYVEPDKIGTTNDTDRPAKDVFGDYDKDVVTPAIDNQRCPVFLDKFDYPILYYRANPSRTQNTRILQLSTETNNTTRGSGVYDGRDNQLFTDDTTGSRLHLIRDAGSGVAAGNEPVGGYTSALPGLGGFVDFIRSQRASVRNTSAQITFSRPVFAESFILLTPGYDGIWGNQDDVGNFEVLSDNR